MALTDEVQTRYSSARLIQLTGANDQDATAITAAKLSAASTDVQADFLIYCATTYDNSEPKHVAVAVAGVVAKLAMWADAAGSTAETLHDNYIQRLKDLAKVTGRDRVIPSTKSVLTPSAEQTGTETVRPDTDRDDFEDLLPDAPA